MWRDRTSRTFFGDSCSRATVDMVPPSGGNKAEIEPRTGEASTAAKKTPPPVAPARRRASKRRRAPPGEVLVAERRGDARVLEARRGAAVLAVLLRALS